MDGVGSRYSGPGNGYSTICLGRDARTRLRRGSGGRFMTYLLPTRGFINVHDDLPTPPSRRRRRYNIPDRRDSRSNWSGFGP